jgi:hypothetical protein
VYLAVHLDHYLTIIGYYVFGVVYQQCSVCEVWVMNCVVLFVSDAYTCLVGGGSVLGR